MKRKIEDYKNKEVAIYCSSKEEWDKIDNLLGKKGLTRNYGDISDPDNMFVDCIHIKGEGTASKKYYEQKNYSIYPASDFLENEIPEYVQLVQRWSVNEEFMGEIFKLDDLSNLSKFQYVPTKNHFKRNILQWIKCGYFVESTKEAYEAQQSKHEIRSFKINDWVVIKEKPKTWSSLCNKNDIKDKVEYPFIAQITKIQSDTEHVACEIGNGGWSLSELIKSNLIRLATKQEIPVENKYNFEVGKWYKNEPLKNNRGGNNYYGKFKSLIDNCFCSSERIIGSNFSKTDYRFDQYPNWELLTDLSEIQQYLPKDHPDKVIFERDYDIYGKNTIPEYVEWIDVEHRDGIKPGMIFKRKECKEPNQLYYTIDVKKLFPGKYDYLQYYRKSFKSSTKEAFELQNHKLDGNNLLPNEIYITDEPTNYIFKTFEAGKGYSSLIYNSENFIKNLNTDYIWKGNIRLATFEEKKWLNTCISQNKFIPKEDLHLYDDSGLLIQKENTENLLEESQSTVKTSITSNCILSNKENLSECFKIQQYYEFDGNTYNKDIYITLISKKTRKLQTITIESTTDLDLNLTQIKSKQIKTIKI